ncbi:MAG TPA: iron ABC transporter permease [Xanthobacteraceae bacterium]
MNLSSRLRTVKETALDDPAQVLVVAIVLAACGGLVGFPIAMLVAHSFVDDSWHFGVNAFALLLTNRSIATAAVNSLFFIAYVTAGCLAVGVPLAWLVARTDVPAKLCIRGAIAVAFIIPSFINVIAWIFLAAPNSGYLNKLLVSWLALAGPPFNIFSFGGLVFIETAHLFPIVFFAVAAALGNIDASHEQAARMLGAGRWRTTVTITLPLVAPAVVSSATLCMLDALSSFGAPAAIGTMANFTVLSTAIYGLLTYPPRLQLAAAVSLPIALFTLVCLWAQQRYLKRNNFVTVTGKANAPQLMGLGAWRYPALALALTLVGGASVLPFVALVVLSLLKAFGTELTAGNFGLQHYRAVFDDSFTVFPAVKNSLILALSGAAICVVLGIMVAWLVERSTAAGRGIVSAVVMVAYGFPSIILGVAVMLGYINVLYGTLTIILIAYVARHLPIGFVFVRSLMKQVSPELEEAARILGAGRLRSLYDITYPVLRPAAFIAWLLIFSLCLREQPMSAILTQSGTEVMSTMVLQFIEDGSIEVAAAISVLIVTVSMAAIGIARIFAPRELLEMR